MTETTYPVHQRRISSCSGSWQSGRGEAARSVRQGRWLEVGDPQLGVGFSDPVG